MIDDHQEVPITLTASDWRMIYQLLGLSKRALPEVLDDATVNKLQSAIDSAGVMDDVADISQLFDIGNGFDNPKN